MEAHTTDFFVIGVTVFFLACIIGYYVVWSVTPALHSPLMGVTNAISSVIIVGAILAAGPLDYQISKIFGIIAVTLASVNIFGGFIVTYRMLSMFKKNKKTK
tara:strand:+ start:3275 stop:3580 length:306 start_codon:yes stop_codon:yes gene_type:complete